MLQLGILRAAAHLSLGEFFDLYPPKLYFVAWIPRAVFQLAFFALLAQFLGGPQYLAYVLVGTTAHATYIGALVFVVSSVGREQGIGTIPLLVASPSHPALVLIGRNAAQLGNAVLTGAITLALATVVLQLDLSAGQLLAALGVILLLTVTVCSFGLLLGGIALRIPRYRNTISNFSTLALTFLCGVYVPTQFLPAWIRPLSEVMPVTHGLRVLRHAMLGTQADVPAELAAEVAVGIVFFGLALVSFRYFLRQARATGTLDFH